MRQHAQYLHFIYLILLILICVLTAGCEKTEPSPDAVPTYVTPGDSAPGSGTGLNSTSAADSDTGSASGTAPGSASATDSGTASNSTSAADSDISPAPDTASDSGTVEAPLILPDTERNEYSDMIIPECISMDDCTPEPAGMTGYSYSVDGYFYAVDVPDFIFSEISGKSFPTELAPEKLTELKYVHVLHYDFNGNICEGELIVNSSIADRVTDIFKELFDLAYPIEKIRLIDEYDGDDEASMRDNNTSAFNYRTIAGSSTLSRHALGLAIDINPLYNPYGKTRADGTVFVQPANAAEYLNRDLANPYYIRNEDDCCRIFKAHGFTWGGDWINPKDYQHFEYPSD